MVTANTGPFDEDLEAEDPDFEEVEETLECTYCGDPFETGEAGSVSRNGEVFCSADCADAYLEDEQDEAEDEYEVELEDEEEEEIED